MNNTDAAAVAVPVSRTTYQGRIMRTVGFVVMVVFAVLTAVIGSVVAASGGAGVFAGTLLVACSGFVFAGFATTLTGAAMVIAGQDKNS